MREIPIAMFKQIQSDIFYHLTNRFHVAVRLFSNRSQMTSKCGKNKEAGLRYIEVRYNRV